MNRIKEELVCFQNILQIFFAFLRAPPRQLRSIGRDSLRQRPTIAMRQKSQLPKYQWTSNTMLNIDSITHITQDQEKHTEKKNCLSPGERSQLL